MGVEEKVNDEQHGYLLSGLDFICFFLPLCLTYLIAWRQKATVTEYTSTGRPYQYTDEYFAFERIFPVYAMVGIISLFVFFRSRSRRKKGAALSAFIGTVLMTIGVGFLYYIFRDFAKWD